MYASVNWIIIGSVNGLSADWYQVITWINVDLLWIVSLEISFSETKAGIQTISMKEIY